MGTLGILLGTWIIHFVFEKEISPAQTCLGLSPQAQWLPPRPQIQYFWYSKSLLKAPQHLPPKELNSVSTQLCQRFLTVPSVLAKNKSHSSTWHPFRYPKMVLKTPRGAWFLPCWQNSLHTQLLIIACTLPSWSLPASSMFCRPEYRVTEMGSCLGQLRDLRQRLPLPRPWFLYAFYLGIRPAASLMRAPLRLKSF